MALGLADDTRATSAGGTPSRSRAWLLPLGAALLLGVFLPLAYAALSGNLGIPHNDTWAFGRSAQEFARTGHLPMFNWNMMGLAGQVVLVWPVGASLAAQSVVVAGLAVAGLAACFDVLCGAFGPEGRRRAAVGTLVVALWPGFALLSTSFMTDVPAFAAVAGTLALGRRALDGASGRWLAASCAVGLWGATVREQVLAAPAAVLAVALFRARYRADRERGHRRPVFTVAQVLGAGVLILAALGVFELWRRGIPGGGAPDFTVRTVTAEFVAVALVQGLLTVALAVSPVVLAVVRPRAWGRRAWTAGAVTLGAGLLAAWDKGAFLGNYVGHDGAYSAATASGRPLLLGNVWWAVLGWLACVSAALLVGHVVQRVGERGWGLGVRPEILLFAVVTVLGTVLEVGQGRDIYDRYLLPLAIPALVVLLTGPLPTSRRFGAAALASAVSAGLVVVTGATLVANAFAFDATVWRTATRLVDSGQADAAHVEAGLVWDGYHSPAAMADHPDRSVGVDMFGALRYLPNHSPCFVVSPSSRAAAGWRLVSVQHYKTYGLAGDARVYVYRVEGSQGCQ
ncbi:hypothetical protein [Catenulispora subtropica]|uniref:Glycosyltransferase RgtA/B/C/D-like domain-containing protein n=1 Tax=Catenulispora subtropica TaxID=450798 RepID=A0ABN2TCM5_9ACTN